MYGRPVSAAIGGSGDGSGTGRAASGTRRDSAAGEDLADLLAVVQT